MPRMKAPKIYAKRNGQIKILTPKEVKQTIMKANNWTDKEYRKKYDILKNKLRHYESYRASLGVKEQPQSVVELLYRQAKSKERYGSNYEPSKKMKQIESFSAVSITKGRQAVKRAENIERENARYKLYIEERFKNLIEQNQTAREVMEAFTDSEGRISNPIMLEKALSDLADKIHELEKTGNEINGETYGSDTPIDFNIDKYL